MKIYILVDNSQGIVPELSSEHGLSLYIEVGEWRLLCDMGASGAFIKNAEILGVDLDQIDFAFISHGHSDHTGGLREFCSNYPDKRIYISGQVPNTQYFSTRRGFKCDISPDYDTIVANRDKLLPIFESCNIVPGVAFIHAGSRCYSTPLGNSFLYSCERGSTTEYLDNFQHEFALAITTLKGLVIVSPCSHLGVANVIASCCEFTGINRVYAFIGGAHFVDSDMVYGEVIKSIGEIISLAPDMIFYTGHCTGNMAKEMLAKEFPNTKFFTTGTVIEF